MKYPPFCDIILIGLNSYQEAEIKNVSEKIYHYLEQRLNKQEFKVLRPMPCPIDKIQNRYRWRIIIKGKMTEEANEILNAYRWRIIIKGKMTEEANEILNACLKDIYQENIKDTRIAIDINPNNMS